MILYLILTFKAKYISILDYMNNYPLLSYFLMNARSTPAVNINLFNEIMNVKGNRKKLKYNL